MNLYFDNGSTSFPKSAAVVAAVDSYIATCGGSYWRGLSARTIEATSIVERCRDAVGEKLGVAAAEHCIFTSGATAAMAAVICGLETAVGEKVFVSPMEHNAVMRNLANVGAKYELLPHNENGKIDVDKLYDVDITGARLVVINCASNVNGVIAPVAKIVEWAHSWGGVVAIDTAQAAGHIAIQGDSWDADYIIFTAHKGLGGVCGVGGFYARNPHSLKPFICGGTGSYSHSFDMPAVYPERFEAGTHNILGIAALLAALENPMPKAHTVDDFRRLIAEIKKIKNIKVYSASDTVELFSIVWSDMECAKLAERLYFEFGIETRSGLHCAPLAHTTIGTINSGTVRISLSNSHTVAHMETLVKALNSICN